MTRSSPSPFSPRRVMLCDYHIERALIDELAACGIDVVVTIIGSVAGVPCLGLEALLDGAHEPSAAHLGYEVAAPSAVELMTYARGASRIGRVPFTHEVNLEFGGQITLDELAATARLHIARSLELLQHYRVDEVWFTSIPHFGLDQALAIAASHANIPVLVTRQLPFPAKFQWSWWLGGRVIDGPVRADFQEWNLGAKPLDLFYMAPRLWDPPGRAWRRRARTVVGELSRFRWRALGARVWRAAVDRRWWRLAILLEAVDPRTRLMAAHHSRALGEAERGRARRRIVDPLRMTSPFVYFPLHFEPEANADVYGGEFSFQPDAIAALSRAIPPDWRILLKENPAQGYIRRGDAFHRSIEMLSNVAWVPDDTSSSLMVERAVLVASLCGTVGYEALLAGKPCLYFGDPWYAGLPGATRFKPGLDLAALASTPVDRSLLDRAVDALVSAAADGIATRRFTALLPGVGESEAMTRLTARSLARISHAARTAVG